MGTFFRGCLTLLAILVVLIIGFVVFASVCSTDGEVVSQPGPSSPMPTPPSAVNASDVFYEYQRNETRANSAYKRRWLTVTLTSIDEIEDGGRVLRHMNISNRIQLDFKNEQDVIRLNPGDSVTAVCKLAGKEDQWLAGGFVVRFFDCRLAQEGGAK